MSSPEKETEKVTGIYNHFEHFLLHSLTNKIKM